MKGLLFILAALPAYFLWAHAFYSGYTAFLIPMGLPKVSIAGAYGAFYTCAFMFTSHVDYKGHELDHGRALVSLYLRPLLFLFSTWCIKQFL